MPRPSANISSLPEKVPGMYSPLMSLCSKVLELEKPSAPASTPSRTRAAMASTSGLVGA